MSRPLDIRRALLRAVDGFLEATPASQARARRLVDQCKRALQSYTLDDIVFGGIALALSDPLHAQHRPALQRYRRLLADGSPEIHRAYLNEDFGAEFSDIERTWYLRLSELLDFLDRLPLEHTEADGAAYLQRRQQIVDLVAQSPAPAPPRQGDEMVYHLVLREVTAIATNIFIGYHHAVYRGRLLAEAPYSMFSQPLVDGPRAPDARESLAWARHALRAIAGDNWLLIVWQILPKYYTLSLH